MMKGKSVPATNEIIRLMGSAAAMVSLPGWLARTVTLPPEPVRMFPLSDAAPETRLKVIGSAVRTR